METWAYDMPHEELLRNFADACAEAGTANSGFVFDIMGPVHVANARYLKGVLLSRLEGKQPPFKRGNMVQPKAGSTGVHAEAYWGISVLPGVAQTITKIHYEGNGRWLLQFKGIPEGARGFPQFKAEEFEAVPSITIVDIGY